jgi:hypothetical protein
MRNTFAKAGRTPIGLFLLLSWVHMLAETYPYLKAASVEFSFRLESLFHLMA